MAYSQPGGAPYVYQPAPQPSQSAANSASGKAASKAGAYGGSEVGSMIGGMVGPPIIGNIIGNLVGERVGERATKDIGLDRAAGQLGDDMGKVIGRHNVDKLGEIALTAFGYSKTEECICCPCLPASQTLLFIMTGFFVFNWYRLGIGIDAEWSCTEGLKATQTLQASSEDLEKNETLKGYFVSSVDSENVSTLVVSYPCEFGFHYLVSGASVWMAFLPFYICTLLGNCWRQCCCCLCDPLVCCATISDLIKRCCCECGKFSVIDFIWYSMCLFQVVWACCALYWLIATFFFRGNEFNLWDPTWTIIKAVLASLILDIILAGSEIFHKIRLHAKKEIQPDDQNACEMQNMSGGYYPHQPAAQNYVQ